MALSLDHATIPCRINMKTRGDCTWQRLTTGLRSHNRSRCSDAVPPLRQLAVEWDGPQLRGDVGGGGYRMSLIVTVSRQRNSRSDV
jgi:hypothetical protein